MKRILVISDIHGEIEKFEQLLEEAQYDAKTQNGFASSCGSLAQHKKEEILDNIIKYKK